MKIINETSYNADDIEMLWGQTRAAVNEARAAHLNPLKRDPAALRVGYYNPKTVEGDSPDRHLFAKMSSAYGRSAAPRLAIVKPKNLPLSALHHLARAGADEMTLTPYVVGQIVKAMSDWLGHYGPGEWKWITSFKLRYSMRAKRGSLMQAKKEVQRERIQEMRRKLHKARLLRAELQQQELDACQTIIEIREQIAKAEEKLS